MTSQAPAFLLEHYGPLRASRQDSAASASASGSSSSVRPNASRPHITLTWAQSLDAKIAGPGGERVLISGAESMEMTHWLRSLHDAILVGINTLIMDDPRLRINLLPDEPTLLPPRPLILDPSLRIPLTARILQPEPSSTSGRIVRRDPYIVCGRAVPQSRIDEVQQKGARVLPVDLDPNGRIPPSSLPDILTELGLGSVMIEGGSRILSSFLHAPKRQDGAPLVDSVVVTVAPMFIGEGVGVLPEGEGPNLPSLKTIHTETMGKDAVMLAILQ